MLQIALKSVYNLMPQVAAEPGIATMPQDVTMFLLTAPAVVSRLESFSAQLWCCKG
jgi:hypothetical protein